MNIYKINYKTLRQSPAMADLLSALERGFSQFDIDFYLVGAAVARDVWMSGIHRVAPRRTIGDIDFAVLINDKGTYEALKEYLNKDICHCPIKCNCQHEYIKSMKEDFKIKLY